MCHKCVKSHFASVELIPVAPRRVGPLPHDLRGPYTENLNRLMSLKRNIG